ncbi:hypothetical protein [Rummeliibacillus sp. TYF-LIM-RU47]|uniref:hypothetical protein n=1 Tax=Rummeliibacillus sp. TYF-LIM-RU47 TaxID=2608406 RepID=UPI0012385A33|nr:hypothetical protein [Rummeliibacillus sp. TYF-LIM-RU47]
MSEYIAFNKVKQLFEYGCKSKNFVNNLVDIGIVRKKISEGNISYNKEDLESYVYSVESTINNCISLPQLSFYISGVSSNKNNKKKVYEFARKVGLEEVRLPLKIAKENHVYFKLDSIDQFKDEYVSIEEAFHINAMYSDIGTFIKRLKTKNIELYEMIKYNKATFVKRSELSKINSIDDVVTFQQAMKQSGLNKNSFNEVLKEYKYEVIRGRERKTYLNKKDVENLLRKQKEMLDYFESNHYDLNTIKCLVREEGLVKEKGELLASFSKIEIPNLIRISKYKNKAIVYSKKQFDEYLNNLKLNNLSKEILLNMELDSMQTYFDLLRVNGIITDNLTNLTWQEWFKCVEAELKFLVKIKPQTRNLIVQLKNATFVLYQFISNNEVYDFKNGEIKLGLFSLEIPLVYRILFRKFLNSFNLILIDKGIKPIQTSNLIVNEASSFIEKKIYSYDNYQYIYNEIKDYQKHLDYIIENDILNKKDTKYIEFWIYCLLHIFTGIRSENATRYKAYIPDLLNRFGINNIHDLNDQFITDKRLDEIIFYVSNISYVHTKNGEKALIYCPQKLKRPFIYALLCYQLKMLNGVLLEEEEIYLKANRFPKNLLEEFFGKEVEFKSKKMTKTLMTLVDYLETEIFNNIQGQTAAILRGHKRKSTSTIKYIAVTQERLDNTMQEIYDTGFFGYLYENLLEFSKGNFKTLQKVKKFEIINGLKSIFGDTLEISQIVEDIVKMSELDHEVINNYFDTNENEKIMNDIRGVVSRNNISKSKNVSCLFNECIDDYRECSNCVFHIPHFYSINVLIKRFMRNIKEYEIIQFKEVESGQKLKQYKQIIRDLNELLMFTKKYGKESIEFLMQKDYSDLKDQMIKLNKPSK